MPIDHHFVGIESMAAKEITYVIPVSERANYERKLQIIYNGADHVQDPFKKPCEEWVDDISLWPEVEFGQIYTYLVETPGKFTRESLKAYKSLEAFNFYIR